MYLKPVAGRQVPDPEKGGYLPAEGREVQENQYWYRRIDDGDVTEALPESPAPEVPEAKPVAKSKFKPDSEGQS